MSKRGPLLPVLGLLFASACVHRPPLNPQEVCASNGMLAENAALSRSGTVSVEGDSATTFGANLGCRRPVTPDEVCEVSAANTSMSVKMGFSPGGPNFLIGVGYVVFIVPGIVLYLLFDHQSDAAAANAAAAFQATKAACPPPPQKALPPSPPPDPTTPSGPAPSR